MSVNKHNLTSGVSFVVFLLQLLWQTVFSDGKKVTMMLNQTGNMIFISGIISIIIQENTLGKNKLRVIYFCRNCVSFFAHFLGQTKTKCKKKIHWFSQLEVTSDETIC